LVESQVPKLKLTMNLERQVNRVIIRINIPINGIPTTVIRRINMAGRIVIIIKNPIPRLFQNALETILADTVK